MKSTIQPDLEKTLDLKLLAWEIIEEAARDREAAKRKRLLGIRLGHLAKMTRTDIARADGKSEGTIRGLERRAGK